MAMDTDFQGRLRNTTLPLTRGLLPLFEAVVNSIHAIEAAGLSNEQGLISIEIFRSPQADLLEVGGVNTGSLGEIESFKIDDNGIGFNDVNAKSFNTLDSSHKAALMCKGVGRLLWLKAFDRAQISSEYLDADERWMKREIFFSPLRGAEIGEPTHSPGGSKRRTSVHLIGFKERYRALAKKRADAIARELFGHCIWYFVREGGAPPIKILDGGETIFLDHVCDALLHSAAKTEDFELKGQPVSITHVRLRAEAGRDHLLGWCAASRVVEQESLRGKIVGLFGVLRDEGGDFYYEAFVTAPFLDTDVRPERTGFNTKNGQANDLFEDTDVTPECLREEVYKRIAVHLEGYLVENRKLGRDRIAKFSEIKAPRYRPLLTYIPDSKLLVDPDISDRDLDQHLHKQYLEMEYQLVSEGHVLLQPGDSTTAEQYQAMLSDYLQKLKDFKQSDLANYLIHRAVIIDLLEKFMKLKTNSKYYDEKILHKLIMPMNSESNDDKTDSCNLWLLDESLAFHSYLASDRKLSAMPIITSDSGKRPDILALQVFDNPLVVNEGEKLPLARLVVVEIKKPMRNDISEQEEKNPFAQVDEYVKRIRNGKATTPGGRQIIAPENIPAYCYIVCDLTTTARGICRMACLTEHTDGSGFFGYHSGFRFYLEVISYDRLLNVARERHRKFFDKLGLPTKS